jgi:hypothetical protein
MRPWQHACSTLGNAAAADTAEWRDALAIHEFLDLSKLACADRRHRIVLHHVDLGAAIAQRAFPAMPEAERRVSQHVLEDLGRQATVADWLDRVDIDRLPQPVRRRVVGGPGGVAELVATRLPQHPSAHSAVQAVAGLLFMPRDYYPSNPTAALALLMNTAGIAIVRRVLGPPRIELHEDQRVAIDFGWIAEAVIMASYGRIPDLRELVDCVREEPVRVHEPRSRAAA